MEDNQLTIIENEQKSILDSIKEITINNDEDFLKAGDFINQIKPIMQNIEKYWEEPIKRANEAHKSLVAKKNEMLEPLKQAKSQLTEKRNIYSNEKIRKAQEEQELLRKAQQEEALKQLAEAEKLKAEGKNIEAQIQEEMAYAIDEVKTVVEASIPKQQGFRRRTVYKVVVIDADKVPTSINGIVIRPIDEKAIQKLAKASNGQIQIDGIKIIETIEV